MPEETTVRIATFWSEAEAHMARSLLESNDIPCFVAKDDCGGMRPYMQPITGVWLIVRRSDADRAAGILGEVLGEDE